MSLSKAEHDMREYFVSEARREGVTAFEVMEWWHKANPLPLGEGFQNVRQVHWPLFFYCADSISPEALRRQERWVDSLREGWELAGSPRGTLLYYLKVTSAFGEVFYKIGITSNTVEQRFWAEMNESDTIIEAINLRCYRTRKEAQDEETKVLREFAHLRYRGPKVLKRGGDTEMFVGDILRLDPAAPFLLTDDLRLVA